MAGQHPAERRALAALGNPDMADRLARLSGADLTSLLLAVMRMRSATLDASQPLRGYRDGRFVEPSPIPLSALRRAENIFLAVLPSDWEALTLSPLVPFGTHAAIGGVSQDRIVSTVRGTEVAADPTASLALEAARRRRANRELAVRLATIQRVIRGQRFRDAPSHFSLFALVTARRDMGGHEFEASALVEHLAIHVAAARAAGAHNVRIVLTDWSNGGREGALLAAEEAFSDSADVDVVRDPNRDGGRGYYEDVCFKVRASFAGHEIEVSDGGCTRWTARLLSDRKERLCISGSSVDRLAAV